MRTKGNRLREACEMAAEKFRKLNQPEFSEIISKLEYCIGSYDFDKNPSGLFEYGRKALEMLNDIKKEKPRKISKELIKKLEDSLF